MNVVPSRAAVLLVIALCAPLSCARKPDSPDAQVRALVSQAETAAEGRDLAALKQMISPSYGDQLGQDRQAIMQLLAYYFLHNQSIHLLTRVHAIAFPEPKRAEVTLYVAMAGRPIPRVEELAGLRADLYRFEIQASDQGNGDWKVVRAAWRPAELTDFL
jgi:hypothetical protein